MKRVVLVEMVTHACRRIVVLLKAHPTDWLIFGSLTNAVRSLRQSVYEEIFSGVGSIADTNPRVVRFRSNALSTLAVTRSKRLLPAADGDDDDVDAVDGDSAEDEHEEEASW